MSRKKDWLAALLLGVSLVLIARVCPAQTDEIRLDALLDKVSGLDWLYLVPAAGERQVQFSSYDRKSRVENGKKIDWFANADSGNYLYEETKPGGKEYVMAEFQGAGMIVRIWSANPGRDLWRIYLDGSDTAVIDEPGSELLSGKGKYFKEPFAGKRDRGNNLIFPIPFQKSCKVSLFSSSPSKPSRYYQVDIVSFPAGSKVETFRLDDFQKYQSKIQEVSDRLTQRALPIPAGLDELKFELEVPAGSEKRLDRITGPGVIRTVEVDFKKRSLEETRLALNEMVLTGRFDGLPKPCIYAPLAAFFGSAPGVESYRSLSSAIAYDKTGKSVSLKSFWPMPFRDSADFSLANNSKKPIRVSGKILLDRKGADPKAMYFHAVYHYLDHHPTRPFSDWTLLDASKGAGRYVGTMLSVRNPDYMWWGEGDEKVFVDGENFPSIFGTGTEDYFSYAWGARYDSFDHAYYGIPVAAKKGRLIFLAPFQVTPYRLVMADELKEETVSQYRWHILDQIPFHQSLRFDLEIWHWTPTITFDLQAMSYWYGEAGVSYELQLLDPEEIPNW